MICLFKDTHSSLEISMILIEPTDFYLDSCYGEVSLTGCLFFSANGAFELILSLQENIKLSSLHLHIWDQVRCPDTKAYWRSYVLIFWTFHYLHSMIYLNIRMNLHNKVTNYRMDKNKYTMKYFIPGNRMKFSLYLVMLVTEHCHVSFF